MNKQEITKCIKELVHLKCIKELVHLKKLYTHAELIELSGISRKTWFDRMKLNNWKKTEILALKYLEIIK